MIPLNSDPHAGTHDALTRARAHTRWWALLLLWFAATSPGCGLPVSRLPLSAPPAATSHAPVQETRLHATAALEASLTVVPPVVVTQNQLVEVRLGLRNPSAQPQTVTVQFYITLVHDSMRVMPSARTLTLPPLATELVSAWWAPVAFGGRTTLLAVVSQEAQRLTPLTWDLFIMTPFDSPDGPRYASAPFFAGAWLELGALGFFPPNSVTDADIRQVVRRYHAQGLRTLVIAYPEFGGCFYYPSTLDVAWEDYSACVFDTRTYFYTCQTPPVTMHPAQHGGNRCPFVATVDLLGVLFEEADRLGMHVLLGLGRSGDTFFALALEDYYHAAREGIVTQIDAALLNRRLSQIVTVSTRIADELWARYGRHRSLYGWFLSHELTCYDVSRNLYDPVATHLKRHTMPNLPVMVAPYAAGNCLGPAAAIPDQIAGSGVDIYFYQDAVGSSVVNPAYHHDVQERIGELRAQYATLAQWHAGTGKHLWSSVEIWRASPTWDQRTSLTGVWATEVAAQVSQAAQVTSAMLLNEGLFYMDHGITALQIPDPVKRASAEALTREYGAYAAFYTKALHGSVP